MLKAIKGFFFGGAKLLDERDRISSSSYSNDQIASIDTPFMKASKMGMNPPVVKRGWLSGYYGAGVRG
jgi:hypothetical protein